MIRLFSVLAVLGLPGCLDGGQKADAADSGVPNYAVGDASGDNTLGAVVTAAMLAANEAFPNPRLVDAWCTAMEQSGGLVNTESVCNVYLVSGYQDLVCYFTPGGHIDPVDCLEQDFVTWPTTPDWRIDSPEFFALLQGTSLSLSGSLIIEVTSIEFATIGGSNGRLDGMDLRVPQGTADDHSVLVAFAASGDDEYVLLSSVDGVSGEVWYPAE